MKGYTPFQKTSHRIFESKQAKNLPCTEDTEDRPTEIEKKRLQYEKNMNQPVFNFRQLLTLQTGSNSSIMSRYQVEQNLCCQIQSLLDDIRDLKWSLLLHKVAIENGSDFNKVKILEDIQNTVDKLTREYEILQKYEMELQSRNLTSRTSNCRRIDNIILSIAFICLTFVFFENLFSYFC
jgi:hypothetical protein